jgi:hypothetical protein
MKTRHFAFFTILAAIAIAAAGCSVFDVVGKTAITTFQTLTERMGADIMLDAAADRWVLTSPGGQTFEWSLDFSGQGPDFRLSFDAGPYLEAGLDPAKLPPERYAFDPASGRLSLVFQAGSDSFAYSARPTPLDTFRKIVQTHRPIIGYHSALDHYGIALGDGNMFEWAKDMARNDKDVVFVLNPQPLIAAGVAPAKIRDWVFAKVPVKDASGRTVDVDKFLKPYDLQ